WVQTTLAIQLKALKNLPNDLRYLRFPLLLEMLKVATKGTETYVRHKWLGKFKRAPSRPRKAYWSYPPGLNSADQFKQSPIGDWKFTTRRTWLSVAGKVMPRFAPLAERSRCGDYARRYSCCRGVKR